MPRIKAKCESCGRVVSLLFDDSELTDIRKLEEGEFFEHKCPLCEEWTAFEVV